jgi:hypothetical protein
VPGEDTTTYEAFIDYVEPTTLLARGGHVLLLLGKQPHTEYLDGEDSPIALRIGLTRDAAIQLRKVLDSLR